MRCKTPFLSPFPLPFSYGHVLLARAAIEALVEEDGRRKERTTVRVYAADSPFPFSFPPPPPFPSLFFLVSIAQIAARNAQFVRAGERAILLFSSFLFPSPPSVTSVESHRTASSEAWRSRVVYRKQMEGRPPFPPPPLFPLPFSFGQPSPPSTMRIASTTSRPCIWRKKDSSFSFPFSLLPPPLPPLPPPP